MNWKVKLEGDDNTLASLAQASNPAAQIIKDGVEWFLESSEFALISDHVEVKEKAAAIVQGLLASGAVAGGSNIALGPVYRMHYDNSKTVYR